MRDAIRFILIPYLLLAAIRLLIAWPLDFVVTPDELKFLGQARYLATGEDQVDPKMDLLYRVGYPALIAPAFFLGEDPGAAFKRVQVINALLMSLIYPLAFFLAGRLRDLSPVDRMLIAGCVSLYPAAMLYSSTAMSANAFMPAFFVFMLAVVAALARESWWRWLTCFAASGFLILIHERAAPILGVTLLALAGHFLWQRRRPSRVQLRLYAGGAVAAVIVGLIAWFARPGLWSVARLRDHLGVLLFEKRPPESIWVTFTGQLWYLGLATCGVLFAGLLFGFMSKNGRRLIRDEWKVPPLFWLVLFGSGAGVFALSVIYLAQAWSRFTFRVYGRYNEGVLLPVLLIALIALKDAGRPEHRRRFAAAVVVTLILLGGLAWPMLQHWVPSMGMRPHSFSASAVSIHTEPFGWGILRASATAGVGLLTLSLLFLYRWRWGVVGLGIFFCLGTQDTYRDTWVQRHDRVAEQRDLIRRIQLIEPRPDTIYWDPRRHSGFNYLNVAYSLPEYNYKILPGKVPRPAGEVVLSNKLGFKRFYPGARMHGLETLTLEPFTQGLWVLPGPLQNALAARHWLLPPDFPSRLGDDVLTADIRPIAPPSPPARIRSGDDLYLTIDINQRGSAPWPHRGGLVTTAKWRRQQWDQEFAVGLLVSWFPTTGEPPAEHWINLPRMLYPGEKLRKPVPLRATWRRKPLPPGDYRVEIAIAQVFEKEHHTSELGVFGFEIEVTPMSGTPVSR